MDKLKPLGSTAAEAKTDELRLPPQPTWRYAFTNWDRYDIPRIWDGVSCVSRSETWDQAQSIGRQADQLNAQADDLERLRERLAAAWSGGQTPAAAAALERISLLISSLRADALAATTTARGVNGVLEAMAAARQKLAPIVNEYLEITNEHHPYAWRHEATRLNEQAREVMMATEQAIRDHRKNIIVPAQVEQRGVTFTPEPQPTTPKPLGTGPEGYTPDVFGPPESGPTDSSASWPVSRGPAEVADDMEQEFPQPIGRPVPGLSSGGTAMLPIFPGSPYAPQGGAYVMPTDAGATGYVMPMSNAPGASHAGSRGGGMPGLMPMPTPLGGAPSGRGGDGPYYRRGADTRWEVRQGIRSVIEPEARPGLPKPEPMHNVEDFREWYTEVAMPWRLGESPQEPAPTVVIRRGGR
ncbi:hypothetical protein [Catellatospora sichuanensis]|uniref:hypothetical protein n=1 Tax=Catellatospora sichuanensis TaxID=1969805 RepID=UPI00118457BC|nr:hypothetical protein [Catellatospora sichuanensis]